MFKFCFLFNTQHNKCVLAALSETQPVNTVYDERETYRN